MNALLKNNRGVTILELLIAAILLSVVLGAAAAIYVAGARFLGNMRTSTTNYQSPTVMPLIKRIDASNFAQVNVGTRQLDIRCDCDLNDLATLTPQVEANHVEGAGDEWGHFRFTNGALYMLIDFAQNTAIPNDGTGATVLISNVNVATSNFAMIDPSAEGRQVVVETTMNLTAPVTTIKTRTAVGGMTK